MKEVPDKHRLAVFLATSGHSGVDRIMKNLLPSIASRGVQVDLLHVHRHGPDLKEPTGNLRVIELGTAHAFSSLIPLIRYLRSEKPDVLFSDKDRVNQVAILAKILSRASTRIVVRTGTTVSVDLKGRKFLNRLATSMSMKYLYRFADRIILPSAGAVGDFLEVTRLPADRVRHVPSPVVTPELFKKARQPPSHPWLAEKSAPVLVGIGELSWRKDFATMIRAFSLVRRHIPAKLIIFGEGRQRPALESIVQEQGLNSDVLMPGFTDNPYSSLSAADLYVHSSRYEGSPVALMEAVALGVPCVSTDCPSGPSEILQDGKFGRLVEVGDVEGMARAIREVLQSPPDRTHVKRAALPYTLAASTEAYLSVLGLSRPKGL